MGLKNFARRTEGGVAIEFAMIAPVFFAMLLGIVSYGGYFWIAHNVQELANDAARAALPGLTASERQQLAQTQLTAELKNYGALDAKAASAIYNGDSNGYTVRISYDAASSGFWSAAGLVPMPSSTIVRSASIKLGGY
ncbi:MAG TPA: TadE/TadG family type IV pilus assembly protein [Rhizomicrobium sp.]